MNLPNLGMGQPPTYGSFTNKKYVPNMIVESEFVSKHRPEGRGINKKLFNMEPSAAPTLLTTETEAPIG